MIKIRGKTDICCFNCDKLCSNDNEAVTIKTFAPITNKHTGEIPTDFSEEFVTIVICGECKKKL